MKKKITIKTKLTSKQIVNALGRGAREVALENSNGFKKQSTVHRNKKKYTRKTKHK